MNAQEHYKALLPVIQAFAEGKIIQVRYSDRFSYDDDWDDYVFTKEDIAIEDGPSFEDHQWEWRVKPVPATKEVCMFWYEDGVVHTVTDPELFNSICRQGLLATRRVVITEGEGM